MFGIKDKVDIYTTLHFGEFLKTMYCYKCGAQLTQKKLWREFPKSRFYRPTGFGIIGHDRGREYYYVYQCPVCYNRTSYEAQCRVAKMQKKVRRRILNEEEIKKINITIIKKNP